MVVPGALDTEPVSLIQSQVDLFFSKSQVTFGTPRVQTPNQIRAVTIKLSYVIGFRGKNSSKHKSTRERVESRN